MEIFVFFSFQQGSLLHYILYQTKRIFNIYIKVYMYLSKFTNHIIIVTIRYILKTTKSKKYKIKGKFKILLWPNMYLCSLRSIKLTKVVNFVVWISLVIGLHWKLLSLDIIKLKTKRITLIYKILSKLNYLSLFIRTITLIERHFYFSILFKEVLFCKQCLPQRQVKVYVSIILEPEL